MDDEIEARVGSIYLFIYLNKIPWVVAMKKVKTIYVEYEPFQKLKRMLKAMFDRPISQEINEFIARRIAELEGTQVQTNTDGYEYEDLQGKHFKLRKKKDRLWKYLAKNTSVTYHLQELSKEVGLGDIEHTLHFDKLDETIPILFEKWGRSKEDLYTCVAYLETRREIHQVEHRLDEIIESRGTKKETEKTD